MNNDATSPQLAPDYYLVNFQFLLDWVVRRYDDVLSDDEKSFVQRFSQLDRASQCLLVRLSSRKGPLFRADKLKYAEIASIEHAATLLITHGLLANDSLLTISEVSQLLTKVELLTLFNDQLRTYKNERKEILVEHLIAVYPEPNTWNAWTNNVFGQVYRLDNRHTISTLLLLFFGNAYQDLTEFVLQDLGLLRYETYPVDHHHRIFKNRTELEQYQLLIALREQLAHATTPEQLLAVTGQLPESSSDAIERRRARLCNQLAYEFERRQEYKLALQLYEQSHLVPARERRVRLLEKHGDYPAAWALLSEILAQPGNEHERQIAERMAPRLAKKIGVPVLKKSSRCFSSQQLLLPQARDQSGKPLRVEDVVRQYFHTTTAPCFYVENLLLSGLFGLWIWPEMFRGIDGAFANPFQVAPLDLYQENFTAKRPGISSLWQLLDECAHQDHIEHYWQTKHGVINPFVNWQFLNKELVAIALACIPARDLKAIFERFLFDLKNNCCGLPDLIQFFPASNSYRMIEVKGPGDRIQDNQQRWLDFFIANKMPVEVCYVNWQ